MGFDIVNEEDCIRGMDIIHKIGVETVVVTSGVEESQGPDTLCCFASTKGFDSKSVSIPFFLVLVEKELHCRSKDEECFCIFFPFYSSNAVTKVKRIFVR